MKYYILTIILLSLLLSNCTFTSKKINSFAKNQIANIGSPSDILIHKNPRIGDYAIHKGFIENSKIIYEILDITDDLIYLKLIPKMKSSAPSCMFISFKEYYYEFIINRKGNVQKALLVDPETQEKTELRINNAKCSKNKPNIENDEFLIKTDAGIYKSKLIWSINREDGKYNVGFVSKDAHFNMVKRMIMDKEEYKIFMELSKIDKSKYNSKMSIVLVEQGNKTK